MTQLALKLRDEGMLRAAQNRRESLEHAKTVARDLGMVKRFVTSDDVARVIGEEECVRLGNAAGSVFKGDDWEFTGKFVASKRESSHGRYIRVWRYRGGSQC